VRCTTGIEEHGAGRQLARFRVSPAPFPVTVVIAVMLAALSIWAAADGGPTAALIMAGLSVTFVIAATLETASTVRSVCDVLPFVADDAASAPPLREYAPQISDRDQRSLVNSAPWRAADPPGRLSGSEGSFVGGEVLEELGGKEAV
jgi:hypothetical protein